MTWNELLARIQSIPEDRRDEPAIFCTSSEMDLESMDDPNETAEPLYTDNETFVIDNMGTTRPEWLEDVDDTVPRKVFILTP